MSAVIAASAEDDADDADDYGETDEEDVTYEKIVSLESLKAKSQPEASDENCLI